MKKKLKTPKIKTPSTTTSASYDYFMKLLKQKQSMKYDTRALIDQLEEIDLDYIIEYSIMLKKHNQQIKLGQKSIKK